MAMTIPAQQAAQPAIPLPTVTVETKKATKAAAKKNVPPEAPPIAPVTPQTKTALGLALRSAHASGYLALQTNRY
jgi:hypothetical protein